MQNTEYLGKQKKLSQKYRDSKKRKLSKKVETYEFLNDLCQIFKPMEWRPANFKQSDEPITGDRKTKNRMSSANSRKRAKLMETELHFRIQLLSACVDQFTFPAPPLHTDFPFEDPEDPTENWDSKEAVQQKKKMQKKDQRHSEITIGGETSSFGVWKKVGYSFEKQ